MLRELVKRTNKKREAEGKMLLPHVTPHTLRRTFASMCFWAKRELPWVMDQIGHEDSRMTVEVYTSASKRKRDDRKLVWRSMRFPDEPKRPPGSGRG
jgi:integrase